MRYMKLPPREVLFNIRDYYIEEDTVFIQKDIIEPPGDTPGGTLARKGDVVFIREIPNKKVRYDTECITVCHEEHRIRHYGFLVSLNEIGSKPL